MASKNDPKKRPASPRGLLDALTFPPTLLFVVLILMTMIRRRPPTLMSPLPVPLAATVVFLYVGLTIAYMSFKKRGERAASISSTILADGLLLLFMSTEMGAPAPIAWGGMMIVLAGVAFTLAHLSPKPQQRFAQIPTDLLPDSFGKDEIKTIMSTIVFPAAFLQLDDEGTERIVAANDPFAAILGRVTDKLAGAKFADVISPDVEANPVEFADAEWISHRTSKGRQTMFMFSPMPAKKEPERRVEGNGIIDPETGLFTSAYMSYKGEGDVQLCRRCKRSLTVVIFMLSFEEKNLVVPSDDARHAAYIAFSNMVASSIRAYDSAYAGGEGEVIVFYPDTSPQGAKSAVARLLSNAKKIAKIEVPEMASAQITDIAVNFFGDELVNLDQVMKDVYIARDRSRK